MFPPKPLDIVPPEGGCSEGLDAFIFFLNPLLRPTGIQIATKTLCDSTSNGTDQYQNGSSNLLPPYREQPRSTRIVVASPRPAFSATKRTHHAPTNFDQQVQVSQGHTSRTKIRKMEIPRSMVAEACLELLKPAREPASSRSKPWPSLKKSHESCSFAAPCGPRRKKKDRTQTSVFPSETSRFAPLILAHRGSALLWLVDDRAALHLHRIWCVPTR